MQSVPADLGKLSVKDFEPHVGASFDVYDADQTQVTTFTLVEATEIGQSLNRQAFSLVFSGPGAVPFQGGILTLTHATLGRLDIFLTPIGERSGARDYQAIFN